VITVDAARLRRVAPHEATRRHLLEVVGPPIALCVGGYDCAMVVAGLHIARTYNGCKARVVCAVVPDDGEVAHALQRQARELALPTAHVLTPDPAALVACLVVAEAVIGAPELAAAFERPVLEAGSRPAEAAAALTAFAR
jgi:hypothetical protein